MKSSSGDHTATPPSTTGAPGYGWGRLSEGVMRNPFKVLYEKAARQQAYEFIMAHWDALALTAYLGFKEEGRGVVMITSDTAKHTSQAAFISEANAQRNASGWPDEETAELVRTYDPETQAVFIILLPVGRSHVHRVQVLDADATPAAIWTRHQGRTPITAA